VLFIPACQISRNNTADEQSEKEKEGYTIQQLALTQAQTIPEGEALERILQDTQSSSSLDIFDTDLIFEDHFSSPDWGRHWVLEGPGIVSSQHGEL
jgi:hypothetical protein